jgi:ABC-type hemin transport system ATPase subunit
MTVSLEVDDLISGWGRTVVVNGVSLTAMPGSTLAVLGRNGARKTTLFATLMGLTTNGLPFGFNSCARSIASRCVGRTSLARCEFGRRTA